MDTGPIIIFVDDQNAATIKAAFNTSPGLLLLFYIIIGTLPCLVRVVISGYGSMLVFRMTSSTPKKSQSKYLDVGQLSYNKARKKPNRKRRWKFRVKVYQLIQIQSHPIMLALRPMHPIK